MVSSLRQQDNYKLQILKVIRFITDRLYQWSTKKINNYDENHIYSTMAKYDQPLNHCHHHHHHNQNSEKSAM